MTHIWQDTGEENKEKTGILLGAAEKLWWNERGWEERMEKRMIEKACGCAVNKGRSPEPDVYQQICTRSWCFWESLAVVWITFTDPGYMIRERILKTSICQDQDSHHFCCGLDEEVRKKRHDIKMLCEVKGSDAYNNIFVLCNKVDILFPWIGIVKRPQITRKIFILVKQLLSCIPEVSSWSRSGDWDTINQWKHLDHCHYVRCRWFQTR